MFCRISFSRTQTLPPLQTYGQALTVPFHTVARQHMVLNLGFTLILLQVISSRSSHQATIPYLDSRFSFRAEILAQNPTLAAYADVSSSANVFLSTIV
jgi:hypothetical protein